LALSIVAILGASLSAATLITFLRYLSGTMKLEELQSFTRLLRLPGSQYWLPDNNLDVGGDSEPTVQRAEGNEAKRLAGLIYLPDEEVERVLATTKQTELAKLEAIGARAAMLWFTSSIIIEASTGEAETQMVADFVRWWMQ